MEFRPTAPADLPEEHRVFCAAEGDLCRRHNLPFVEPPIDALVGMYQHALQHDAERSYVAAQDGHVLGFAHALRRGAMWILAALFVEPDAQGQGIGTRLLDLVWVASVKEHLVLTDATGPAANALYVMRGLAPQTVAYALRGRPRTSDRCLVTPHMASLDDLAPIDLRSYGFDRSVDHSYWSRVSAATIWRRGSEAVAYSYVAPDGRIGPVAGVDSEAVAEALGGELLRAIDSGGEVSVLIPACSTKALRVALSAGLAIEPPAQVLFSHRRNVPASVLFSNYFLL